MFVEDYEAWVAVELGTFASKPYLFYTCWFFDHYQAMRHCLDSALERGGLRGVAGVSAPVH
jgi:hypothetical protein